MRGHHKKFSRVGDMALRTFAPLISVVYTLFAMQFFGFNPDISRIRQV
jgi:hypothetical protein